MPVIEKRVLVKATPEAVFDLVTRVEEFPSHVSLLKEVTLIGVETYHWSIVVAGIELSWDGIVTRRERPHRFAWKSLSGQPNSGAYELKSTKNGTLVRFRMEYYFQNTWLEWLLTPVLEPLMNRAAEEAIAYVKRHLEKTKHPDGAQPA